MASRGREHDGLGKEARQISDEKDRNEDHISSFEASKINDKKIEIKTNDQQSCVKLILVAFIPNLIKCGPALLIVIALSDDFLNSLDLDMWVSLTD